MPKSTKFKERGICHVWVRNVRITGYGSTPNKHLPPGTIGDMEVTETSTKGDVIHARFHPGGEGHGYGLVLCPRWEPCRTAGQIGQIVKAARLLEGAGSNAAIFFHNLPADEMKAAAELPGAELKQRVSLDGGPPNAYEAIEVRIHGVVVHLFGAYRPATDEEVLTYIKGRK